MIDTILKKLLLIGVLTSSVYVWCEDPKPSLNEDISVDFSWNEKLNASLHGFQNGIIWLANSYFFARGIHHLIPKYCTLQKQKAVSITGMKSFLRFSKHRGKQTAFFAGILFSCWGSLISFIHACQLYTPIKNNYLTSLKYKKHFNGDIIPPNKLAAAPTIVDTVSSFFKAIG